MGASDDRPIAQRRTPRRSLGRAVASRRKEGDVTNGTKTTTADNKARTSKKRVRFSDAGPQTEQQQQQQKHNASSTGLTPMVRRSSLGVAPSPKRRRTSTTPLRRVQNAADLDNSDDMDGKSTPTSSIIHFASLRQVLDDRMKRRIRRNGLSEEMNSIDAEKRQRDADKKAELQRLRDQLARKDEEIERLRDSTILSQDTDRIMQLELELESLRGALSERAKSEGGDEDMESDDNEEWTLAAQDPFSDDYSHNVDDEGFEGSSVGGFGDSSMEDLACSTPSRAASVAAMGAFPTPPSTSPAIPTTPFSYQNKGLVTPSSNIGVQVSNPSTHMGVQVSNPSSHMGVQVSNPSTHMGVQVSNPSSHMGVQVTNPSSHMGIQVSNPSSHMGVQVSNPSSHMGMQTTGTPSTHAGVQATTSSSHIGVQASSATSHASVQATTQSSDISVQAALPDPERQALETELDALRQELTKLTETLESHEALKTRLSSKIHAAIASSSPPTGENKTQEHAENRNEQEQEKQKEASIESHLDTLLQNLSDRTAALQDLNVSLLGLGFPGADGGEVVASLAAAFRAARLELEYLAPGELALPLASHGAEVLDVAVSRLRALGRKSRDDDAAIDEYHAQEQSLRQQLRARVDAGDKLQADLREARAALADRDARVEDLEVGLDRCKGALADYRRDVAELEALAERLEAEGREAECALQVEVDAARAEAAQVRAEAAQARAEGREAQCALQVEVDAARAEAAQVRADLEGQLAEALANAQVLEEQMPALLREHAAASAEARAAAAVVRDLRSENQNLAGRADDGRARAREVVDALRMELERVVRMSTDMLAGSATATTTIASATTTTTTPSASTSTITTPRKDAPREDVHDVEEVEEEAEEDDYDCDCDCDDENDETDAAADLDLASSLLSASRAVQPGGVNAMLALPATPTHNPAMKSYLRQQQQQPVKKRSRRRRYDSGLGFMDEDEEDEMEDDGYGEGAEEVGAMACM
ncbi:hypothetical protein SLS62_000430 [Diatrype stigma]|uniref:Uncharacterized protein n=1 Tax=Diatrype stigma TaxID=117547 RepID=A0AAN9V2W1_9PEZI